MRPVITKPGVKLIQDEVKPYSNLARPGQRVNKTKSSEESEVAALPDFVGAVAKKE